ncbi:hypothetical protein ANN_06455 [Periplaneta americana]|uniref:Uncharacterized protein n=1 Tax=Periplaneta americana TaxID=6978 RepID=A0ABQ8TDK2_PERAM|nr:hypothetical protein ANN_06455 [Periplaneta americana]
MGESRNAYRVLVGRPGGKRPFGRPRRRWEDNIKKELREVRYDDRDWINLAKNRDQWRAYVRAAMTLRAPLSQAYLVTPGAVFIVPCEEPTMLLKRIEFPLQISQLMIEYYPTIRFEKSPDQILQIDEEKKQYYKPCCGYVKKKYSIDNWEVMGLFLVLEVQSQDLQDGKQPSLASPATVAVARR